MRKSLFVLLSICFLWGSAGAQIEFNGGLTAGALMSQVHGDGHSGFFKIGATGGGFVDLGFSRSFTTRLEILYTQKGSRNRPDSLNFSLYKLKLDYIEIPVTAKWMFTDWSLDAGLHYAVLVNSSEDFGNGQVGINPPYNSFDIGGHLGGSYYLSEKVNINFRYSQSILPIRAAPDNTQIQATGTWDAGGYNYIVQLMMAFAL